MSRRGSGKPASGANGGKDRKTLIAPATASREPLPVHPRRGNRGLLIASALLFLAWLAVLAWLNRV